MNSSCEIRNPDMNLENIYSRVHQKIKKLQRVLTIIFAYFDIQSWSYKAEKYFKKILKKLPFEITNLEILNIGP